MAQFDIRPLCFKDVAPLARILGKIGMREFGALITPEAVRSLAGSAESREEAVRKVGASVVVDALGIVCLNYDKAEADLHAFLASMAGMRPKDVAELPLADALELLHAVFTAPGFADFFTRAQSLLK